MATSARFPPIKPDLYVVGMDAELRLGSYTGQGGGNPGDILLGVSTWQLEGNFADEQEQPPGSQLVVSVMTAVSFRLSLTESVWRTGDKWLLQHVMQAIYEGQIPQFSFQGRVGTRIVKTDFAGTTDSHVSICSIDWCQPTGAFDLMNVRPGGILRRALNFNCNSAPFFESYL